MSRLYNYFVLCWTTNPNFTETQLNKAVEKEYITADEETTIKTMEKASQ
ncbi:hypothetical protein [Clostridium oryzae]|uniref:XkdX family protein n=1 Tax=Clostridium oryzae TaxID=1450648 RepID=A0A1V4IFI9_9CLOT|nr:hypothetical protein [Clostridium oryzae]OPJ58425.1 hypothetical protein CLORY_35750 [Clostridium oryzae]